MPRLRQPSGELRRSETGRYPAECPNRIATTPGCQKSGFVRPNTVAHGLAIAVSPAVSLTDLEKQKTRLPLR